MFEGKTILKELRASPGCLSERIMRFSQSNDVIKAYMKPDGVTWGYQPGHMKHTQYKQTFKNKGS